jgi:hypothetical protein
MKAPRGEYISARGPAQHPGLSSFGAASARQSRTPRVALDAVNGGRRSFALLRPIADTSAQERICDLVLPAYADDEGTATEDPS